MKLDSLLAQHLYSSKEVTLQGLGKFVLNSDINIPFEKEKEQTVLPEGSIDFVLDNRAVEDTSLVDFIVAQTKKMRPLVSSDIDSYLILAKQFLNIGKPFFIEGIGTLTKNQAGSYDFVQGLVANVKQEVFQSAAKEKAVEEISFASEEKSTVDVAKILKAAGIAVLLGAIGVGIWFLVQNLTNGGSSSENKKNNTTPVSTIKVDTNQQKIDSNAVTPNPNLQPAVDGSTFTLILKTYSDSALANFELGKFIKKGHKLNLVRQDSVYVLKMPCAQSIADTVKVRDSIRNFYFPKFKISIQ